MLKRQRQSGKTTDMPSKIRRWIVLAMFVAMFALLITQTNLWQNALSFLFPGQTTVLRPGASLLALVGQHIEMVAISSGLTVLIGLPLAIWVTRPSGAGFLPIVTNFTSVGQTFPPVAVLALSVPLLGFGLRPTIFALFLYGMLPVVRNTVAGLKAVPRDALDTARGMGMSHLQSLLRVELPLAAPVILAGIRTSVVINIGTATVGAIIGAGGLGSPIIAGLVQNNQAYLLEGAVPVALLAVLADQLLSTIEHSLEHSAVETVPRGKTKRRSTLGDTSRAA
jgi:osmoprotectant transport system permease protein